MMRLSKVKYVTSLLLLPIMLIGAIWGGIILLWVLISSAFEVGRDQVLLKFCKPTPTQEE